jgi:hypothetical protein
MNGAGPYGPCSTPKYCVAIYTQQASCPAADAVYMAR